MRLFLLLVIVVLLSGCADRIHVVCKDCAMTNDSYMCKGCVVEAYASRHDGDILAVLPPIIKPKMKNPE